jgi:hypothetical protein
MPMIMFNLFIMETENENGRVMQHAAIETIRQRQQKESVPAACGAFSGVETICQELLRGADDARNYALYTASIF